MTRSDQQLSSDLIFEIVTRTSSLQTLDTCKSVSKEWNSLIENEPTFLPTYCKRTNNISGYFIQDIQFSKYSSMFVSFNDDDNVCMKRLPDNMRILASCNQGLLCCLKYKDRYDRYYVVKPATDQWLPLPNPKLRYETSAIAIIVVRSSPLQYKIVRLSRHTAHTGADHYVYDKYRCEIFDSETWTWRENQQALKLPYNEFILDSTVTNTAISASNCVNWLTSGDNVISFDKSSETFDIFSLPDQINSSYKSTKLVEYNGRLGFTCLNEDGVMELWLRDVYENSNGWSLKVASNIEFVMNETILSYPSPAGFYNAQIALINGYNGVVFYNMEQGSLSTVRKLEYGLTRVSEVFHFRSDLEFVDLKGGLQG